MQFRNGVPATARCLDGHFPGNSIVPGAVLLGYAANAFADKGFQIASVVRMKFQRPLLPEQPFEIEIKRGSDAASMVWRTGDTVIAQARVTLCVEGE